MRIQALYVQGCARSGNTLMRDLSVAAFRNAELLKITESRAEMHLEQVIEHLETRKDGDHLLIASRTRPASVFMDSKLLHSYPQIGVIWMLRNPLDVLTSVHKDKQGFYVEPYRLIASLNLYNQFRNDPQVLTVRYEDLVADPAQVQGQIASHFQLEVSRNFVDCHEHFPRFKQNLQAVHSIRPIDSKSIEKWRSNPEFGRYLAKVIKSNPEIISLGKACGGYEIDGKALRQAADQPQGGPLKKIFGRMGGQHRSSAGAAADVE